MSPGQGRAPRLHAYGIADRGQAELLRLLQLLVPVAGLHEPDDASAVQLPAAQLSQCQRSPLTACVPRLAACRAGNSGKGHVAKAERLKARRLPYSMRGSCTADAGACCTWHASEEL